LGAGFRATCQFSRVVPEGSSSRDRLFAVRRQRLPGSDVHAKHQSTVDASSEESASVLIAEASWTPKISAAHFRTPRGTASPLRPGHGFHRDRSLAAEFGQLGTSTPERCCPYEPPWCHWSVASSTEVERGGEPWAPRFASRDLGHHFGRPQAVPTLGDSNTRDAQRIAEAPSRGSFPFGERSLGDCCVGLPSQHHPLSRFLTFSAV
jgi:hypothetical protein